MIEQQARVIRLGNQGTWVRVGPQAGCAACDAGKGCGAGIFSKLLRNDPADVLVPGESSFPVASVVRLGVPETVFLKWVTLLYGLPVAGGLFGGVAGYSLARSSGAGAGVTDLLVLSGALLIATLLLKFRNRTLKPELGPNELHILGPATSAVECDRTRN